MRPSQLRLWLSSMAYVLLCAMLAAGRTLTKQTAHCRPPVSYTAFRLAVVASDPSLLRQWQPFDSLKLTGLRNAD